MSNKKNILGIGFVILLILVIGSNTVIFSSSEEVQKVEGETAVSGTTYFNYLPSMYEGSAPLLCRFGVNVLGPISQYDYVSLRSGWYANYIAEEEPDLPKGTEFVQTIRFRQIGADGYNPSKDQAEIEAIAIANPGSKWLVGNEPDRSDFQDDLVPLVYAKAYHDTYEIVKNVDPTAKIYAGTIVQPTPVRLEYLDLVLSNYQSMYGTAMPVDGWSIHNFVLNEVSCDYDPDNCWGAEIPPGVDADFGEILTIEDNKNLDLFEERIVRFRQWMFDNGYAGLPVMLSEYGVLIPEDFSGFSQPEVNVFMTGSFEYMLAATDPVLGDPNDEYRLIQQFSWYSTGAPGDIFNGNLFDKDTQVITSMGLNYANYASTVVSDVDLLPSQLTSDTAGPNIDLTVTVGNAGNLTNVSGPATVRFYDGDPSSGGVQIGSDSIVSLSGCGTAESVTVTWNSPGAGPHTVYALIDEENRVAESDESNNQISINIP
ncbi:MAG: CARDB domain-containing protein [Chloroflexota bacterium]